MPITQILDNAATGAPRPNSVSGNMGNILNGAIPGFNGLTQSATDIIKNLMSGQPSSSPTKRANAYFGANSGMPGSDFVRNRGFDLYGEKSDQYQQRGFQDLLALLSGYSGTVMPTTGQQLQSDQFQQELGFKREESALDRAMRDRTLMEKSRPATPNRTYWSRSASGAGIPVGWKDSSGWF